MTTMIEMIRVPYGAECFSGFRHTKDGHIIGNYSADEPVSVEGGDVLYVEIRDEDRRQGRCRVVMVNKSASDRVPTLAASNCRNRGRRQAPLTKAERAAIALQAKVVAAESAEADLKRIETKQAISALFNASNLLPRDERVIRLRFMHDLELRAVSEQLGLTIERVRQIEGRGLRKMKRAATVLARRGAI